MGNLAETKDALRKEIGILIDKITFQKKYLATADHVQLNLLRLLVGELLSKISALEHLEPVIEERMIVEVPVAKEIPQTPKEIPVIQPIMPPGDQFIPKVMFPFSEKKTGKKLPEIKTLIGFNEKLMFIAQLFGGNISSYEEALKQIDACSSLEEVTAFLSAISSEYKWKDGSDAVVSFRAVVKRRFA
ncbi:MAG: hypothetical protein HY064_02565 [Bacteroidetes bacterium]|nr:hypothetical protein [Bacteroidota bacterium]